MCLMLAIAGMMATGCSSCQSGNEKQDESEKATVYHDYDGVVQDFTAGVSHIQAMHRQTMFKLQKDVEKRDGVSIEGYQWRNSQVQFNDTLKLENIDDVHITDINDVFYYWHPVKGPQVQFINTNVKNGTQIPVPVQDVWIEDEDMSTSEIKLSAEDVLQRLKEVNCPIPPAKSMILRKPLGPCECNAQWVVGGIRDVLFIDAVTGDVSNWNPAFNPNNKAKGGDFGKPLGEWP